MILTESTEAEESIGSTYVGSQEYWLDLLILLKGIYHWYFWN